MLHQTKHHPISVFKLVDGVLQLAVEHRAVGNYDHRSKLFLAPPVIERGELMGSPGNRIGFTGTGAMLNQLFMASAFISCRTDQLTHHIPLVITGEDQRLFPVFTTIGVFFLVDFQVDKAVQNI